MNTLTRRLCHASACAALVALAACKTPPAADSAGSAPAASAVAAQPAPPPSPPPASPAPPARPTLPDEQRRLSALFHGTPVVFAMQADGAMRVDVPLRFCFEPGKASPKPSLLAVLDRIAQSQRDGTSRITVRAAADTPVGPKRAASAGAAAPAASNPLPARRAASVRDRLAAQGIAAGRLVLGGNRAGGVTLLVKEAPAP